MKKAQYAINKIKNEAVLSRTFLANMAQNILLKYRLNNVNLFEQISNSAIDSTNKEITKFIEKYTPYIDRVVNKRKYYLGDESDDCKQFICISLYHAYHKKHKYTDWDRVVRAIIKRRAVDFSKIRNNQIKGIVNETDFMTKLNGVEDGATGDDIGLYKDNSMIEENMFSVDCYDTMLKLKKIILKRKEFNDTDKRIIKGICSNVKNGNFDLHNICENIGMDEGEIPLALSCFCNKIKRNINKNIFL